MALRVSVGTAKSVHLIVEGRVGLAEGLVLLPVVLQDSLEVLYPLVLPFPIGSL